MSVVCLHFMSRWQPCDWVIGITCPLTVVKGRFHKHLEQSHTARDRTLAHRLNFHLRSFCYTTVTIATMSNLQAAKKLVEQLRVESDVQRLPVSRTIQEMIQFIEQHKEHDPLIVGIDKKTNPFHERSSCTILWTCSGLKHIHVIIAACRLDYKLKSLLISECV